MSEEITINSTHKDFESIKHVGADGVEYWSGRDLMPLLGYLNWREFESVIKKAMIAARESNQVTINHFGQLTKMVKVSTE